MITEVKLIKQSETGRYRIIEKSWTPGKYFLEQRCGCWKTYAEYKMISAAIKKMDKLDMSWKRFLEDLENYKSI